MSSHPAHIRLPLDRYPLETISILGHRTAYIKHGTGPPMVLLHGYAGAIWNWEQQLETLGKDFTLYVPDLLGQGVSDKPRFEYTPQLYIDWLMAFLNALELKQPAVVGNSMGAGLALGFALVHPQRVRKLVLISGLPAQVLRCAGGPYLPMFAALGSGLLFSLAYRLMGRRAFRKFLRGIVHNSGQITPAVIERAYRLRKEYGAAWPLWSSLSNLGHWEEEFVPRLGTLTTPTLIIWGREDRFFPLDVGEELHRAIPGSKLVVVADAGHLPMWEQPTETNRLMREFLSA